LERDRTQNRIPLLLIALLPDLTAVPSRFLAPIPRDSTCFKRMGRLPD
jgi:hypothetical protein